MPSDHRPIAEPETLVFPWPEPPAWGEVVTVADGLLWFRLPLPYRLDHVNIYLIADGDGWAAVDTGLGDAACREGWQAILDGPLAGQALTRLIVTHFHPDHVGLAGWLAERFGLPLHMPRTEYLNTMSLQHMLGEKGDALYRRFYERHGLSDAAIGELLGGGHDYLRRTTGLPLSYHRLAQGDELRIGARVFSVITGGGHALEQGMLYCADERLFLSADQVIAKISPNIAVYASEPGANALGDYLHSLHMLVQTVPADVLVLPGHGLPFEGLHARAKVLTLHHEERCALIRAACRDEAQTVAGLVPILFPRLLDAHQTGFAFVEVLAHVNYMAACGELQASQQGVQHRYRSVAVEFDRVYTVRPVGL